MAVVEVFIDEARNKDYLICAVVVPAADLTLARKQMRTLKPGNRDRVHMHTEGDKSRRKILAEFVQNMPITEAHLFKAAIGGRPDRAVRDDLLREAATLAAGIGAQRIVVESCSQDKQDFVVITGALVAIGALDRVRVAIERPRHHELLWAADVVAYAYNAGGAMRACIRHFVTVHEVP